MVVSGCLWRIGLRCRKDFDSRRWVVADSKASRAGERSELMSPVSSRSDRDHQECTRATVGAWQSVTIRSTALVLTQAPSHLVSSTLSLSPKPQSRFEVFAFGARTVRSQLC